jgi:hypothetical protein
MPGHSQPARMSRPTPSHHPSGRLKMTLASAVAVILAGTAGCASATARPAAPASTTRPPVTSAGQGPAGKGAGTLPGTGYPPAYWLAIRQQLASRLHRSVTELTQLWAPSTPAEPKGSGEIAATTTIVNVAAEDGLTVAQLRRIELTAIRRAFTLVVQRGATTRHQANVQLAAITGWDQSNLDGYAMYAFQPH